MFQVKSDILKQVVTRAKNDFEKVEAGIGINVNVDLVVAIAHVACNKDNIIDIINEHSQGDADCTQIRLKCLSKLEQLIENDKLIEKDEVKQVMMLILDKYLKFIIVDQDHKIRLAAASVCCCKFYFVFFSLSTFLYSTFEMQLLILIYDMYRLSHPF